MVFHDKRKRKGLAPTAAKPRITINDLPDELILNVLEHVDTPSILKLRETGRAMVPVATTALRERLKTLYVHPSKTSVRRAIAICNSDLSSEIEEVCFVNKVVWEKLRPQDIQSMYILRAMPGESYKCPWPGSFALTKEEEESVQKADSTKTFVDVYDALLSSLSLCPKVQAFSVENECTKPGFNMISNTLVHEYSRAGQPELHSKERAAEDRLYQQVCALSKGKQSFTDVDAILSILLHPDIKLSRLSIAQDFSNAYEIHWRLVLIEDESQRVLRAKMAALTRLDLHCTTTGMITPWQLTCSRLIKAAASDLQHLSLSFCCNASPRRVRYEESLRAMIDGSTFPMLERLELRAFPSERRKHSKHKCIPLVQHYDLANFLVGQFVNYGKLRALASSNVLAAASPPDISKEDLIKQMHEVLENANVKFEWTEEEF